MAGSPRVLPREPHGPAAFRNQHSEGSPRRRGGAGRCGSAPGWLLPFHVQGQSAHVRQDRGRPPKPCPRRRRARRGGTPGAWDVGHEHAGPPDSPSGEARTPRSPPRRLEGGVRGGHASGPACWAQRRFGSPATNQGAGAGEGAQACRCSWNGKCVRGGAEM